MKSLLERNVPIPTSQEVEGITDTVERYSRSTLEFPAVFLDTSAQLDGTTQTYLRTLISPNPSPGCLRVYLSENGVATDKVGYLHKTRISSWHRSVSSDIYTAYVAEGSPLPTDHILALS